MVDTTLARGMVPRAPIAIDTVFSPGDAERFWRNVCDNGPFPALQQRQVMQSSVEMAAITGEPVTAEMLDDALAGRTRTLPISASFRAYWARAGAALRDDTAWLLAYERFVAAARQLFGPQATVRPDEIYVNAQVPQTVRTGSSHVDIPKFRGMGRREYPVWLLTTMRRSQLFERWRIPVATVVAWFYDGPGGTYTYWPEGPLAPPRQTRHPFTNTAVVGENDTMFHRGDSVGPAGAVAPRGLTTDCVLAPADAAGERWQIRDGARALGDYPRRDVRVVLSWSAEVCVDEYARRTVDEHLDDLDVSTVIDTVLRDLDDRGLHVHKSDDYLHDPRFIAQCARAYSIVPTVFPTREETLAISVR